MWDCKLVQFACRTGVCKLKFQIANTLGFEGQEATLRILCMDLHNHLKCTNWASLVAQWLRICLPMQGTRVRALVWEDPTCHGATKPVSHNYWACAPEPPNHHYWARVPQLLSPCSAVTEAPVPRARALQQEKPLQWRPNTAKNK